VGGDAEDINKLTYQKTGLDWSRPVFVRSWNFGNGRGPWTGPRSQSFAVLGFPVLIGPSPVQSRSFSGSGTGLPNTRPDIFRANQPGPTSVLQPGDFLAPGRLPNACSTERDFQCRMTTAACARTGGFNRKRVCPRTRVALTAASTARGLPKTTSADDKTRSAGYQPSAPCAEHRQFLRILNSPAGP